MDKLSYLEDVYNEAFNEELDKLGNYKYKLFDRALGKFTKNISPKIVSKPSEAIMNPKIMPTALSDARNTVKANLKARYGFNR